MRDSWNVAAGASPVGTWSCPPAWHTDFRADLAKIDVPTLVVHGTADRTLPIDATGARTKELVKDGHYLIIDGAPHGCLWTHADEINRALLEFLGGDRSASPESAAVAARPPPGPLAPTGASRSASSRDLERIASPRR